VIFLGRKVHTESLLQSRWKIRALELEKESNKFLKKVRLPIPADILEEANPVMIELVYLYICRYR